jgi:isoleucyl-tRNA synthetase
MAAARDAVTLGLAARGQAKIKVRQPLRAAVIVATSDEREALERLADVVREELNVKELRFTDAADDLGRLEVKPNYRTMGPKFGKDMPLAAAAVEGLDPGHVGDALREGNPVHINVGGTEHALGADDLLVAMKPLDGYQLEHQGSHAVALELALDDELLLEGLAREIVHAVQGARKDAGLEVEDRIKLTLGGDQRLMQAADLHKEWISGEVLSVSTQTNVASGGEVTIDGFALLVSVERA